MGDRHILVIEDEEDIVELLRYNLEREGYQVSAAHTGVDGFRKARTLKPDLVLLDLMLPEMNGLEICRRLKESASTKSIPIIMLTAKTEEADTVSGLEMGADDYVPKPFSPRVLLARIRAVMRRMDPAPDAMPDEIVIGKLVIRPGFHQVILNGRQLKLTHMEFLLLETLAMRPGWVFSRSQIVSSIRGGDYAVTDRAVDVLVVGLRKKLGDYAYLVETVRGVGYRFSESGA